MQTSLIKMRIEVNNIHAKLLQMLILAQTETYDPTTHTHQLPDKYYTALYIY